MWQMESIDGLFDRCLEKGIKGSELDKTGLMVELCKNEILKHKKSILRHAKIKTNGDFESRLLIDLNLCASAYAFGAQDYSPEEVLSMYDVDIVNLVNDENGEIKVSALIRICFLIVDFARKGRQDDEKYNFWNIDE